VKEEKLSVQGMSCAHCVNAIESNVGELAGVESVAVRLEDGEVDVSYDTNTVSLEEIVDTIENQGYDVIK
jgi:copper chaperone